jgi:hypothetical protein
MQCPLICLWAVEYHCPHRVSTQFGVAQVHPPVHVDTSIELHGWAKKFYISLHALFSLVMSIVILLILQCRYDRKRQKKRSDWSIVHYTHIRAFDDAITEATKKKRPQRPFNQDAFNNYLTWFLQRTRVELCPPAYDDDILDEPVDLEDFQNLKYNKLIRDGQQTPFAPVINFVVSLFDLARLLICHPCNGTANIYSLFS